MNTLKRGDPTSHQIGNTIKSDMRAKNAYIAKAGHDTLMQPSTQAHLLTERELDVLRHRGQDIYDAMLYLNQSYLRSITRPNFSVSPFKLYLEDRLTQSQIHWMRAIAANRPPTPFYRIDMTRPVFIVENQTRIAGLGLVIGVQQSYENHFNSHNSKLTQIGKHSDIVYAIGQHILKIQRDGIILLITSPEYLLSDKILAHLLNLIFGLTIVLLTLDQLEPIDGDFIDMGDVPANQTIRAQRDATPSGWHPIRFILRRAFNLHSIVMIKNYQTLLTAYLDNRVGIFPELNLLEDSKLGLACMSLNFIKQDFPEHLHNLYPTAGLVPMRMDEPFFYGDKLLTLNQIIEMCQSQRKFVLKYAGDDLAYGCFGGRAVYRLFKMSANQVRKLFELAISQTRMGHPWMLQELDLTYYESEYLDKTSNNLAFHNRLHARNMLFYNKVADGDVQLIAGMLNLRSMWKVSGANDAIIAPLYTAPNIDVRYEPKGTHYTRRIVTFDE